MRNKNKFFKLNFGCGNDSQEDAWNVDIVETKFTDQVFNFEDLPYDLPNEHYEYILAKQVFEHLSDNVAVVYELYKKLRKGGVLEIQVPYWKSPNMWVHPQHKRGYNYETFDYFCIGTFRNKMDGHWCNYTFSNIKKKIVFQKKYLFWNSIAEYIVNLSRSTALFYEYTGLCNIFPADGMIYYLTK